MLVGAYACCGEGLVWVVPIQRVGVRHLGFVHGRALLVRLVLFLWRFDKGAWMVQPARPVLSGPGHGQSVIASFCAPIWGAIIMQPMR